VVARFPSQHGSPLRHPERAERTPTPPEIPPRPFDVVVAVPVMMVWILAFTPHPAAWATLPGLVGWLTVVEGCRRFRTVVLATVLFGAIGIGYGYRWLAPTVQLFGGLGPVSAIAVTCLYGIVGTLHGIVFAIVYRSMLRRGHRPHPLATVVLFVGCEALPIRLFPWLSGHGAIDVPPLAQAAEWGGVVGVSLVLCCLVVPFREWLVWATRRDYDPRPPARPMAALVTFCAGVAFFGFGLWRYHRVHAEDAAATRHLRVSIVQADVGSLEKRHATEDGGRARFESLAAYHRGTMEAVRDDPDLIVWPETAITDAVPMTSPVVTNRYLEGNGYGFLTQVGEKRAFLVGLYEEVEGRTSLTTGRPLAARYNAAGLRQPGGPNAPWEVYRKVYLIPFGERMPFGLLEDRLPQNFEMKPGAMPQDLLHFHGLSFAPFLCYEGTLADHVREYVNGKRPDVLVSMANDSWFGDTWEPHQHLNFTRFRAIEHRAPLVRATNTGVSAFVDATGDVITSLGVGKTGVLTRDVPIVDRTPTVYVRWGWRLPWALWILALLAWIDARIRPPPVVG
jgi:apolipoprotein N-acyltransferase